MLYNRRKHIYDKHLMTVPVAHITKWWVNDLRASAGLKRRGKVMSLPILVGCSVLLYFWQEDQPPSISDIYHLKRLGDDIWDGSSIPIVPSFLSYKSPDPDAIHTCLYFGRETMALRWFWLKNNYISEDAWWFLLFLHHPHRSWTESKIYMIWTKHE